MALLLAGALAYPHTSRSLRCPKWSIPIIQVSAGLPGASPETMASAVATPLERMFGRIAGINQMTSTSQLGSRNHRSAVRSGPQHRCRRAATCRRPSTPRAASCPPTCPQSELAQDQSRPSRPFMVLALTSDTATQPADVRRGRFHPGAEDRADQRHRPGKRRRQFAAGRARRGQPDAAEQARRGPRPGAHRACMRPTPTRPRASSRTTARLRS